MSKVKRILVEKMNKFDVDRAKILSNMVNYLQIKGIRDIRVINCYDIEGLKDQEEKKVAESVLSEINTDYVYYEEVDLKGADRVFRYLPLPGQFDLRSESAIQCIKALLTDGNNYSVESSKILAIYGGIKDEDFNKIKEYFINPVELMEAPIQKPNELMRAQKAEDDTNPINGFNEMSKEDIIKLKSTLRLALTEEDLLFIQEYYKNKEKRVPTYTEIKVFDVYWSDHCRHTTFNTEITNIDFSQNNINSLKKSYEEYLKLRKELYKDKDKPITLMDLAVISAKYQKKNGNLNDLEVSDEINASSIRVPVNILTDEGKKTKNYLVMFKNETHNHPTEIEPFGGASTCLGGAIRDPLSGRSYVYHSMRVTGCADPRKCLSETIPGKLPQRKITTEAAKGFSSYGNQIGLATGHVGEIYHEGYAAKRMEVGAVIGAAPEENVVRKHPENGDLVLIIGGRTGRDGCGGASGSSVEHNEESIKNCGAEVQKGNAIEERKLQRLFRNPDFTQLVKKCNDFGAGGVSVAIGELADSIDIYLDKVPKKYEGLTGTEIAISESQERMAVMIDKKNYSKVLELADRENLECTQVAEVTDSGRLRMFFDGRTIIDISRDFLETNGAKSYIDVKVPKIELKEDMMEFEFKTSGKERLKELLGDLNVCSQRGLIENFDNTIGCNSVVVPFGGSNQKTPTETMVARISVKDGISSTCSMMSYGFDPVISSLSPFHGAYYAVISSMAKIVASGGDKNKIRFTFQEYFEKLGLDANKWSKPFSSLLGANLVLTKAGLAAVGGKDSMSGTFNDINVPPTLISFAVSTIEEKEVITPEFKDTKSVIIATNILKDEELLLDLDNLFACYDEIRKLSVQGKIKSAVSIDKGGIIASTLKSAFGNGIGVDFDINLGDFDSTIELLSESNYGNILLEIDENTLNGINFDYIIVGKTRGDKKVTVCDQVFELRALASLWEETLESVFPTKADEKDVLNLNLVKNKALDYKNNINVIKGVKPKIIIPSFPGTNCEEDTANAFKRAGGDAEVFIFRNLTPSSFEESINYLEKAIKNANILAIPGGFSAGDEPDGSGKYIASVFRNQRIKDAVNNLIKNRDGLAIGICNGFQALVKLGLVTYGEIRDLDENSPTLTYNTIGRHQAKFVNIKIVNSNSPWLTGIDKNLIYKTPISHGEGKFYANQDVLKVLIENGQIATQYSDLNGNPAVDSEFNPNGSIASIEGIVSPDGRVIGKMGHTERVIEGLYKNIPDINHMDLFGCGVRYFVR